MPGRRDLLLAGQEVHRVGVEAPVALREDLGEVLGGGQPQRLQGVQDVDLVAESGTAALQQGVTHAGQRRQGAADQVLVGHLAVAGAPAVVTEAGEHGDAQVVGVGVGGGDVEQRDVGAAVEVTPQVGHRVLDAQVVAAAVAEAAGEQAQRQGGDQHRQHQGGCRRQRGDAGSAAADVARAHPEGGRVAGGGVLPEGAPPPRQLLALLEEEHQREAAGHDGEDPPGDADAGHADGDRVDHQQRQAGE